MHLLIMPALLKGLRHAANQRHGQAPHSHLHLNYSTYITLWFAAFNLYFFSIWCSWKQNKHGAFVVNVKQAFGRFNMV